MTADSQSNKHDIYLDYDPQYQGIVKTSAYLWFVCFAIFMVVTVLLISNLKLFEAANAGDWDGFLRMLGANPTPYNLIKGLFIVLRVIYILTILGTLSAVWKLNPSASVAMLGFTLVSLPVMLVCQAFQMVMVPLAHDYAAALTAGASGTLSTLLVTAKTLYTMTDIGDAFVSLVLFDGILISWALIALKKPHPRYFVWWMLLLAVLPLGRFIGFPILGLVNAVLTGILFLVMGLFMLRFAPLERSRGM